MSMWSNQARFYARTNPKPDCEFPETTAAALDILERLLYEGEVKLAVRVPLEREQGRSTRRREVERPR